MIEEEILISDIIYLIIYIIPHYILFLYKKKNLEKLLNYTNDFFFGFENDNKIDDILNSKEEFKIYYLFLLIPSLLYYVFSLTINLQGNNDIFVIILEYSIIICIFLFIYEFLIKRINFIDGKIEKLNKCIEEIGGNKN